MIRLILLISAVIFAAIASELGLRVIGWQAPVWHQADSLVGWVLRPGISGVWSVEGRADVRVSSAGLRDREHTVSKPPGVYRIAIIGDSYSEAMHVPVDSTYWARLPADLERCGYPHRPVEMLNFGVSGHGTAQELLMLPRAWRYRPDLVLLQVTVHNDIRNNVTELEAAAGMPFFVLDSDRLVLADKGLRRDYERQQRLPRRVFRALLDLRLVQLFHRAWTADQRRARGVELVPSFGGLRRSDLPVFAPPRDAVWTRAWNVTERLIEAIRDSAAAHAVPVAMVIVATPSAVSPRPETRAAVAESLGVDDLLYPDRRLLAAGKARGIPTVSLGPPMAAYAESSGTFLHGFGDRLDQGHWNAAGHRVAARTVAGFLCHSASRLTVPLPGLSP